MKNTTTLGTMRFLSMKGRSFAPRTSQREARNGTVKVNRLRRRGQTRERVVAAFLGSFRLGYRLPDVPLGFFQSGDRLGTSNASSQHHQSYGGTIARSFERSAGGFASGSGGAFEDRDRALDQFFVLGRDVDHEVAIDVAQPRHGSSRNHIKDHLVGFAGLHAGRAGQDFGAHAGDDGEMSGALERGIRIAGERDGMCAAAARFGEGGDGEGSASTGGDAEDHVMPGGFALGHIVAALLDVILADLGSGG